MAALAAASELAQQDGSRSYIIVTEAIFRTLNTEENGLLVGDDLDRGLALLGIEKSEDVPQSLRLNEFQELCEQHRDEGGFDILKAVCSLQMEGGISLFDWENGELNESFKYIDSNNSGTVDSPEEMGKLLYYAGIGNEGSKDMATTVYSLFDSDGDGTLNLEEVRRLLRSVKGASIILYLELLHSTTPDECGSRRMGGMIEKALHLRDTYNSLSVPGAGLFPHLLANVNALDDDQTDSNDLSSAEFEALVKGAPNKKMQALRDTLMCEGAPWEPSELVSAAEVFGDGVVNAQRIPRALPGHAIDNLDELDWRVVRENFSDYFFGIDLIWDQDLQDSQLASQLSIFGSACDDKDESLQVVVNILVKCLLALPPAFLARKEALKRIYLVDGLCVGEQKIKRAGCASGTTIWVNARASNEVYVQHVYNVVFHELYHCIDDNDNSVNPDPEDRLWRALNVDGWKYAAERTPPEDGGCAMQGHGACTQGFASDYGIKNIREDKATVFELWMTRRPLALARISATYEAKEVVADGTFNEEYEVANLRCRPMSARGPDRVLEAKVARLIEEVVRFAPEMADVLKISPESRIAVHVLAVDDPVLCKYVGFRDQIDNPWFMGTVAAIDVNSATIRYEDGDESSGVLAEELYYCPQGPFDMTIGKSLRSNDVKNVVVQGNIGPLQPIAFGYVLAVGDAVLCKYPGYRGQTDNPWFMGTVAAIDVNSATIRYEDGDESSGVLAEELYYCPQGPFDMTIGKSLRSNDFEVVVARANLGLLRPVAFSA